MAYANVGLAANNSDATINLDDDIAEDIYVRVSGTFVGTLTPGASIDGTNYDAAQLQPIVGGAAVATVTAPGAWRPAIPLYGARFFRLRLSPYTSGTAVVEISTTMTAR